MQRLLEIPQEAINFLRNFRLWAGDLNREGGSKTAPFTHPLPGVPAPLAGISILQQSRFDGSGVFAYSAEVGEEESPNAAGPPAALG